MSFSVVLLQLGVTPVRFRVESRAMPWSAFEAGVLARTGRVGPLDYFVDGGKV
jgi:hypothetical protein